MARTDISRNQSQRVDGSFAGFGQSIIVQEARRPLNRLDFSPQTDRARRQVLDNIPVCPGVYGWLSREGCLLYVGKSKSLRHRLANYFSANPTDAKMEKIRRQSRWLVWEANSHELVALLREQELIDRFRPSMNVQGKPERRKPGFVCISRGVAANAFFSHRITPRAAEAFGPVAGTGRLREAVTSLNYVFQLRDCPDKTPIRFSNQLTLFDDNQAPLCLRHELASCPAPCSAGCSTSAYGQNVQNCMDFLQGKDKSALDELKKGMVVAAGKQSYERASVLRDQLNHLSWLYRRLHDLRKAQKRIHGVLELPGFDHRRIWLVLRGGLIQLSVPRPETHRAARELSAIYGLGGKHRKTARPESSLEINWLLIMIGWMRKHPDQMSQVVPPVDLFKQDTWKSPRRHCA